MPRLAVQRDRPAAAESLGARRKARLGHREETANAVSSFLLGEIID